MAQCITSQAVKLRADDVFGTLGYLQKRQDLQFLNAFMNEGIRMVPGLNSKGKCVSLTVSWKNICEPEDVACNTSCDVDGADTDNCTEQTYPIDRCFQVKDALFNTAEYDCTDEVNSGRPLTHRLDEAIAKKDLEAELRIVQDQIIPYMIGVVDGAVSAPVYVPKGTSVNANDELVVKASSFGKGLYNIVKKLIARNNITRPLLIVGNEAVEDSWSTHQVTQENALLGRLFNEIPVYFDYLNIFGSLSEEAIFLVNLDAFAFFSWNELTPNITSESNIFSLPHDKWHRYHDTSRFSSAIKLDKLFKLTCASDSDDVLARRLRSHAELLVAPDGICQTYPKVIKIVCGTPTVVVGP